MRDIDDIDAKKKRFNTKIVKRKYSYKRISFIFKLYSKILSLFFLPYGRRKCSRAKTEKCVLKQSEKVMKRKE
uniref:Uncharacterized protein n=1 Tax=Nyssomyia neivai TaxID=330878 RepID=A0A1L8D7F1_9DIPT